MDRFLEQVKRIDLVRMTEDSETENETKRKRRDKKKKKSKGNEREDVLE